MKTKTLTIDHHLQIYTTTSTPSILQYSETTQLTIQSMPPLWFMMATTVSFPRCLKASGVA